METFSSGSGSFSLAAGAASFLAAAPPAAVGAGAAEPPPPPRLREASLGVPWATSWVRGTYFVELLAMEGLADGFSSRSIGGDTAL